MAEIIQKSYRLKKPHRRWVCLGMVAAGSVPFLLGIAFYLFFAETINPSCFRTFTAYNNCLIPLPPKLNAAIAFLALFGYFFPLGAIIATPIGIRKIWKKRDQKFSGQNHVKHEAITAGTWAHFLLVIIVTSDEQVLGGPMKLGSLQLGDYIYSLPFVALFSLPFWIIITLPISLLCGFIFTKVALEIHEDQH